MSDDKIEVRNINAPHHVTRVDRAKYEAMKAALMDVLPGKAPGITDQPQGLITGTRKYHKGNAVGRVTPGILIDIGNFNS